MPEFQPKECPETMFMILDIDTLVIPNLINEVIVKIIPLLGVTVEYNCLENSTQVVLNPAVNWNTEPAFLGVNKFMR
jgi:hypothetical protein